MALPPSQFGYSCSRPMHREARHMLLDRDKREKTRIEGEGPVKTNPLTEQTVSAGYSTNADRFTKDVAKQLHVEEKAMKDRTTHRMDNRREANNRRQHDRWEKLEVEDAKTKADLKAIAGTGMRNKGSVGYNLVNGSWGSSEDAAKAKYQDDRVEYSAKKRSDQLDRRGNSGPFNILTGEQRTQVKVPPAPQYHPPGQ